MTDVEAEEFREWFQAEHLVLVLTSRQLHDCHIELTPDDADDFAPSTKRALEKEGFDAAIFQRKAHPPLSAQQLFGEWYAGKQLLRPGAAACAYMHRSRLPSRLGSVSLR